MTRLARPVFLLVALALFAAACGTRVDKDAYFRALREGGAQVTDAGSTGDQGVNPDQSGTGTGTGASGGAATASSSGTGGSSSTGKGSSSSGTSALQVSGLSTAEIGDTIRIGFHVPVTGAAPMPTNFEATVRAVESYFNQEVKPAGRKVKFFIEDDGYDVAMGLAACKKLVSDNIVLAIGHTMPAAEDACARLFEQKKIPYLMRGTYPELLNNRPLAWFGTTADNVQGRLMADYIVKRMGAASKKSAIVYQNDQVAARDAFIGRMKANGGSVSVVDESVPRQGDYSATIQKLQQAQAAFVYLSMPPVDAIKISVQAQGQGYHPTWLGGGSQWNYNMVLESAGMAMDGAINFSPWPSIDSAAAADFKRTFKKYQPTAEPDDIGLIIWGWANLAKTMLANVGPRLSVASMVAALNSLTYNTPYWVPVSYRNGNHLGPTSVAVFQANGQEKRWKQISGFTASF